MPTFIFTLLYDIIYAYITIYSCRYIPTVPTCWLYLLYRCYVRSITRSNTAMYRSIKFNNRAYDFHAKYEPKLFDSHCLINAFDDIVRYTFLKYEILITIISKLFQRFGTNERYEKKV